LTLWKTKSPSKRVVKVLTPVYETDFLSFSYGFRPGRNQHQALDALWVRLHWKRVNWVLDADIKAFFAPQGMARHCHASH